jgi:hypothetical protein
MKTNDRELKKAYREYVQNTSGTREKVCPGSEEIWSLFSGKISRKRRARMVDHITACSSCFREFEAFLEITRVEGNLARGIQSRFPKQPRRIPRPMVWRYVTALLIFVAVLAVAMLSTRWPSHVKRSEERGRLSGQIRLLAPGQNSPLGTPLIFRWEELARSEYYIIEIFDDSLLPFWKSPRLTGSSFELPSPVKEKLDRRKRYFWMLTAFSQGGTKSESALEEFSLID